MIGQSILKLVPEHLHSEEKDILKRLRHGERIESFETVRQRKDGTYISISLTISPIRNGMGTIVGASKIARDNTSVKDKERRIRVLLREINHRVKNQYAIILSMIRLTRDHAEDASVFERQIRERIMALSASHDLLVSAEWAGAPLSDVIHTQLRPFRQDHAVTIDGPPVILTPTAVENLGMAFHELAMNSSEKGVLNRAQGTIVISWAMAAGSFEISWVETFEPETPRFISTRSGFGSIILKRIAPQALNSAAQMVHEGKTFTWSLQGPLDGFVAPAIAL
ncbi:UNVERIFIED_ORG: two-component sensor histidine kinase [Ensifer adhaerens]|nr:two-component sensor histidine kinase [Ensifer adhaerens]